MTVLEAQSYVGSGATTWGGDFNSYQNNFHPGNGYATIKTIRSAALPATVTMLTTRPMRILTRILPASRFALL